MTEIQAIFDRFLENGFSLTTGPNGKSFKALVSDFKECLKIECTGGEAKFMMANRLNARPLCSVCNDVPVPFLGCTKGYQLTCSIKCSRQLESFKSAVSHPDVAAKRNKTCKLKLESMGLTNFSQQEWVKEKIKNTNLERYGFTSATKNQQVKDKTAQTNLERYGAANVLSGGSSIREKINEELTEQKVQTQKRRENAKINRAEQIFAEFGEHLTEAEVTNLEKYGVKNVFSSEDIKNKIAQTNLERYGQKVAAKNATVASKISSTKIEKYKQNYLPAKLKTLARVKIIPHGWVTEQYAGGSHEFLHTECNTVFNSSFYSGDLPRCPKCSQNRSMAELITCSWLEEEGIGASYNNRAMISPLELDILTDKIAIEINGVYWHSDNMNKAPLLKKTELCIEKNIELLHFWDIEIAQKPDLVRSIILAKHGKFKYRIGARQLKIRKVEAPATREFFNSNHLQGFANSTVTFGLYNEDLLVAAMSFGKPRFGNSAEYEIIRFAVLLETQIIGGASKLLKHFVKQYTPASILSFADRRISTGKLYSQLGFQFIENTKPNYFYYKNNIVKTRYETQKHLLPGLLGENFNPEITETANMLFAGWIKCSDSGNSKWIINY